MRLLLPVLLDAKNSMLALSRALLPPDEGTWRVAGIAEGLNRL